MQRINCVFSLERPLTRDRLEKNATEGKNVRAVIDLVHATTRLFGRHIAEGAHHHTHRRMPTTRLLHDRGGNFTRTTFVGTKASLRFDELRQTKVQDLRVIVTRDHDIVGLKIAVNDSSRMSFR